MTDKCSDDAPIELHHPATHRSSNPKLAPDAVRLGPFVKRIPENVNFRRTTLCRPDFYGNRNGRVLGRFEPQQSQIEPAGRSLVIDRVLPGQPWRVIRFLKESNSDDPIIERSACKVVRRSENEVVSHEYT